MTEYEKQRAIFVKLHFKEESQKRQALKKLGLPYSEPITQMEKQFQRINLSTLKILKFG